jgi:tRNA(His) guanylyltransferase
MFLREDRLPSEPIKAKTGAKDSKMEDDLFGTRMKEYEGVEAGRRFLPMLPVCARLDGKCFHNYTAHLPRPYDVRLHNCFVEVTRELVEETNAVMGYTQSDEITLCWYSPEYKSQIWFDGRIQKMCSVLASMCTAVFNREAEMACINDTLAFFDCRVWQLPTLEEAANSFLFREQDATKNAISMAASSMFSHKQLMNKCGAEMQEMMFQQKKVNFNEYPAWFKRGTFIQRRHEMTKFSAEELDRLPAKHEARKNPDLMIERSKVKQVEMPKFSTVTNRVGVIFNGEDPKVATTNESCTVNIDTTKKAKKTKPKPDHDFRCLFCGTVSDRTPCPICAEGKK